MPTAPFVPMLVAAALLATAAVSAAQTVAPGPTAPGAATACPSDPAPATVQSVAFYTDPHGSVIDPEKLRQYVALNAPLRRFVTDASRLADSDAVADGVCARQMMLGWAAGGALLGEPADFAGQRDRERYTIALNVITLKLKQRGYDVVPLLSWLGGLNGAVLGDFGKRDRSDNLYLWSGVAAASYALVAGDRTAKAYEDTAWSRALTMIRPDGYVDTELARAGRALGYHVYYLSALLTLHAVREALNEPLTQAQSAIIGNLVRRVNASLCDPSEIVAAAGGTAQEPVAAIEFSPLAAFAGDLANAEARSCWPQRIPTADPILGGDFANFLRVLAARRT